MESEEDVLEEGIEDPAFAATEETDVIAEGKEGEEDAKEDLPSTENETQEAGSEDAEVIEIEGSKTEEESPLEEDESPAQASNEGGVKRITPLAQDHPDAGQSSPEGEDMDADGTLGDEPLQPSVDVKFVVAPEGFVHLMRVPTSSKIEYLYDKVSDRLRCNRRHVRILYRGELLLEHEVLSERIDIVVDGHLLLHIQIEPIPRHLQLMHKFEVLDSVVGIQIDYGDGIPPKTITVTVVRGFQHKQYMGGYRNKKSAIEYHHATAQTDARKREPKPKPPSYSRDTQTMGISRSMQTKREACTQMARPGLDMDTSEERWVISKPYFSARDLHTLRVTKCIALQAIVRGWFARRLAKSLREEEERRRETLHQEEMRSKKTEDAHRQREIERRTHPRTPADFAILYNELEAWRLQEAQKIKDSSLSEAEKHLARQELLKKETRLLQTIDKLQIKANSENKKERIASELTAMAANKTWKHSNPELGVTVVETPFTVRAKELLDLYNGLQLKGLSVDERLDVLLHVKWSVKEFECALTREIVELIDREADLLNRGRKDKSLEGLRQRMSNLFLQFCETPEFNPEAIHHQRVPLEFTTRPLVKIDANKH